MYTITLNDGTRLENLELNGNNFISERVLEDAVFENNLDTVTISDGARTENYEDMQLIANRIMGGKTWFVLAEKTAQQKAEERMRKLLVENADSITDVQIALAEVYEMILGGL